MHWLAGIVDCIEQVYTAFGLVPYLGQHSVASESAPLICHKNKKRVKICLFRLFILIHI